MRVIRSALGEVTLLGFWHPTTEVRPGRGRASLIGPAAPPPPRPARGGPRAPRRPPPRPAARQRRESHAPAPWEPGPEAKSGERRGAWEPSSVLSGV